MRFNFSSHEKNDILKAWVAISFAFGILISRGFNANFLFNFIISFITVGIGFLFHELAHKFVAQKYRYFAEFRADNKMLLIAIVSAFFGFIFAAPGGVIIEGNINKKIYAKIAAAGPFLNIIIALLFLGITSFNSIALKNIGQYGFTINSWLALFNLIPIFPFDGEKIVRGDKKIYFCLLIISLSLMFLPLFR